MFPTPNMANRIGPLPKGCRAKPSFSSLMVLMKVEEWLSCPSLKPGHHQMVSAPQRNLGKPTTRVQSNRRVIWVNGERNLLVPGHPRRSQRGLHEGFAIALPLKRWEERNAELRRVIIHIGETVLRGQDAHPARASSAGKARRARHHTYITRPPPMLGIQAHPWGIQHCARTHRRGRWIP